MFHDIAEELYPVNDVDGNSEHCTENEMPDTCACACVCVCVCARV